MEKENKYFNEIEIDLNKFYTKVFVKGKITFIIGFLLSFDLGLAVIQFSPKIYRVSMRVQLPVNGGVLPEVNEPGFAENLKGLIINGAFTNELGEKLKSDFNIDAIKFAVVIPDKENILQISVDLENKQKEFGVALLNNLYAVISARYAKRSGSQLTEITNLQKQNERVVKKNTPILHNQISNLKIAAQPKVSPDSISPNIKKILILSLVMGMFIGIAAVFLQDLGK